MDNREYSLLILGNFESVFIVQFVKNLKKCNPQARLYFWGYTREESDADRSFLSCYEDYCLFGIRSLINSSVGWRITAIKRMRKSLKTFIADKHFDYVNIHYIKPEYVFLLDYLKRCASTLVLSPWGSDVLGINWFYRQLVKRTFNAADFVTGSGNRFTQDFMRIFKVPERKYVSCTIGVEPIEYIFEHKIQIDVNEAKRLLGIDNHYVITCGYKALEAHQHIKIIEAIHQVRNQLPDDLLLLFPLTYPNNTEYVQTIKQKVNEYGMKAIYFEQFLDIPHLFLIRQATDMFIHVQPTDASSGSLWEYILCEKKIINGAWLQYPELVKNGRKPFFEVDTMENLGHTIVDVYQSKPIAIDRELFAFFENKQWKVVINDWDKLFSTHIKHR